MIYPFSQDGVAMQLRFTALLLMLGMTSMTGCASTELSGRATPINNSNHHWLTRPPAMVAMVDGTMQNGPVESSPTEAVKQARVLAHRSRKTGHPRFPLDPGG
jgi:hypothetical protein